MKDIVNIKEILVVSDIMIDYWQDENGNEFFRKGIQLQCENGYFELYENGTWHFFEKEKWLYPNKTAAVGKEREKSRSFLHLGGWQNIFL